MNLGCHVKEVGSLKEGEWSCYRGVQFNGDRMGMLQRWCLMESMIMLQRGGQLMEREWSFY